MGVAALSFLAPLAACASSPSVPSVTVTSASAPDATLARRPSVAIDPPEALPSPAALAGAGGVVALRVPVSRDAVVDLVQTFFDAWQRESIDDLVALLTHDAGPLDARARGRKVLTDDWRQRMRSHEYGRLAGIDVVRPERIERSDSDLLTAADGPVHVDVRPGEMTVRVPVEVPTVGGDRLFGDTLVMILRPEAGQLRIAAYGEVEAR